MTWWERITRTGEPRPEREPQRLRRDRLRSVYERPEPEAELPTHLEVIHGHLVEVRACCSNPLDCHREECWRPLG